MRLLRELSRRKLRTTLTIIGITIGIWALVVFSSMANKINGLVGMRQRVLRRQDRRHRRHRPSARRRCASTSASHRRLDGVAAVQPRSSSSGTPMPAVGFGVPDLLIGTIPGADAGFETFTARAGHGTRCSPPRTTATSSSSARPSQASTDVAAGGTVDIRGRDLRGRRHAAADAHLARHERLSSRSRRPRSCTSATCPRWSPSRSTPDELANQIVVYPEAGADPTTVRRAIEAAVENSATMTGAEFDETVGATTAIFNAIIIGVAAISLIVGGLSVINTMAMSVAERTREIGIRRAIGGSRRRIIRELVAEAGRHRADRRPDRARPGRRGRRAGQRGRPLRRHRPLRPHPPDRGRSRSASARSSACSPGSSRPGPPHGSTRCRPCATNDKERTT